jgi:hypothetical protein
MGKINEKAAQQQVSLTQAAHIFPSFSRGRGPSLFLPPELYKAEILSRTVSTDKRGGVLTGTKHNFFHTAAAILPR